MYTPIGVGRTCAKHSKPLYFTLIFKNITLTNNMKLTKTIQVSIRIIFIYTCAILMSIIPESFPELFGDTLCSGFTLSVESGKYEYYMHYGDKHYDVKTHWGYRHWLFFYMGLSLFITQVVRLINYISEENK